MADYTELVKALRDDNACLSVRTAHEAAEAIEGLQAKLKRCTNELCLRCGSYRDRHLGACDGCVFYEPPAGMEDKT